MQVRHNDSQRNFGSVASHAATNDETIGQCVCEGYRCELKHTSK